MFALRRRRAAVVKAVNFDPVAKIRAEELLHELRDARRLGGRNAGTVHDRAEGPLVFAYP